MADEVQWFKRSPTGGTAFLRPGEPIEETGELPLPEETEK